MCFFTVLCSGLSDVTPGFKYYFSVAPWSLSKLKPLVIHIHRASPLYHLFTVRFYFLSVSSRGSGGMIPHDETRLLIQNFLSSLSIKRSLPAKMTLVDLAAMTTVPPWLYLVFT